MEIFRSLGQVRCFVFSLGIMLLLSYAYAKHEYPYTNVNLSPFWQWRSAYECLQNKSTTCSNKDITNKDINMTGVVDVNNTEVDRYCNGGCAQHTGSVLYCISLVHRHFWFANGLTIHKLNDTINDGCNQNKSFSTAGIKSSATKSNQNLSMSFVSSFATLIIIGIFAM